MIRYIRVLGAALGGLVGLVLAGADGGLFGDTGYAGALLATWVVAWIVVGFALLPYLTVVPATWLIRRVEALSTAEFVTAIVGLLLGLLMGLLLGLPARPASRSRRGTWLPLGVSLFLGLGHARPDRGQAARPAGRRRGGRPHPAAGPADAAAGHVGDPHIVVDTSAIIDGRIAEIVESGFIYGTLVVPRFVLDELQHIADSSDTLRRNRGRRGLEILARMQKDPGTPVEIVDEDVPDDPEVDAKLVALARTRSRVILTNDFNLNRVAELQGVRVMNINSLANAVKPARAARRGAAGPGHPGGQGGRPGRRLPRRRHDDRRRGRRAAHRQGPRRRRHARAPDRRRPDDLRPTAAGLTSSDVPPPSDAIVVAAGASSRMGGRRQARLAARRPPAARAHPDGDRRDAGARARGRRDRTGATGRRWRARRGCLRRSMRSSPAARCARTRSPRGSARWRSMVPDPTGDRVVLVHDGARPILADGLAARVAAAAATYGAAIPVLPVSETVKRIDGDRIVATEDRATLALAQTPQGVRRGLLRAALADPRAAAGPWTDEAALLEACRIPVHVVPGDPTNLKVTVPTDLARAASLVAPGGARRHGIGHDSHPFGPGAPLRLGGLTFEGVPRLVGHSDGDVALHAVADALLGAAGLGDLGRQFPRGSGDTAPASTAGRCSTGSSSGSRPPAGDRVGST